MRLINYEIINQIKQNLGYYLSFFLRDDYPDKLASEFNYDPATQNEESNIIIHFDMSVKEIHNRKDTDFANAIKIYETYSNLSESEASDERIWTGLAIQKNNMDYLFYRWGKTINTIKYRAVYHVPGKRGMMYHGLARLWWFVHITVLENNDYSLTEFSFEYPHILEKMIYRNFSNSRTITHSVIKGIREFIENGGEYTTKKIDELYKYVSLVGGNILLDSIPEQELAILVSDYLNSISE
jgi:hypothetical protein